MLLASALATAAQPSSDDLFDLSLEELMNLEVVSATRLPTPRAQVASAVHVITEEQIRRSGVTTIMDALRLVPGVHVAQIDSNKWAIGIRGFTDQLSRSMLVLIDGRALYSPLFAGVFWDVQDCLLDDIERIEVIRGPGGTLWGSNAVNGIINIITKEAAGTQGDLVKGSAGTELRGLLGYRHGGRSGDNGHYRVYAKGFDRDAAFHADGADWDEWWQARTGFRGDWDFASGRSLTVQSDLYKVRAGQLEDVTTLSPPERNLVEDVVESTGWNVLSRLRGELGAGSDYELQAYYDRTNRDELEFAEHRDTVDLAFQHRFAPWARNEMIWGVGYRRSDGRTEGIETLRFIPADRTDDLLTAFLQDEIELSSAVRLTAGAKLEYNDYTDVEFQPSVRLLWEAAPSHSIVFSVTRAVRTPTRVEHDLEITSLVAAPVFLRLVPNEDFESEQLLAWEAGYRGQPTRRMFVTFSAFFNDHEDLFATQLPPPFLETEPPPPRVIQPVIFANGLDGSSYGLELTSDFRATTHWRIAGSYSVLSVQVAPIFEGSDLGQEISYEGSSPRQQLSLQSFLDLPGHFELDWIFRALSDLEGRGVPGYATSDLRLGWRRDNLELSLTGQNLHEAHHLEFPGSGGAPNVEIERSVHANAVWVW